MKYVLLAAVAAASLGNSAFAGAPEPYIEYVYPELPWVDADWSGFYAGGIAGPQSGTVSPNQPDFDALTYGVFAGFNHQQDQLVFGAEIAAQSGALDNVRGSFEIDHLIDAKLRVGYSVGDALLFASGGYSTFSSRDGGLDASGWSVGAGVDYAVTGAYFVGGEYTYRDLTNTTAGGFETTTQGAQLRAGIRF